MTTSTPSGATPTPPDDDLPLWDGAATTFLLELLDHAQSNAKVWAEGVAAMLGIFGTVALVAGPDAIDKVAPAWHGWIVGLTAVAGLFALASLWKLTIAQQLPPISEQSWSGSTFRTWTFANVATIRSNVTWGRRLGIAAAAAVFVLGLVVLYAAAFDPLPAAVATPK